MYALLLDRPEELQNPKLPETWARLKACPFSEAAIQVRKCWGILADNLSPEEAKQYEETLKNQGVAATARDVSSLVVPPPVQPVKAIGLSTPSLSLHLGQNETLHPWSQLTGLFAFALNEAVTTTAKVTEGPTPGERMAKTGIMLATGIPLPIARKKTVLKTITHSELLFFIDLIFAEPLCRFRIDGQHLDYSFLGPKKEMGSQGNFRLLFEELRTRVPNVLLNKGSRVLAARQPVSTMGYETTHDIDRETRWYLSTRV